MTDEELQNASATQGSTTEDLLQALNEVKANSVSKTEYDKLREDNRALLNQIVNGTASTPTEEVDNKPTVAELRSKLGTAHNDMEYVKSALELREAVLEETGKDIFANYAVDDISYEEQQAAMVADVFQQCLDQSDGNPAVFKAQLMTRLVDTPMTPNRKRK